MKKLKFTLWFLIIMAFLIIIYPKNNLANTNIENPNSSLISSNNFFENNNREDSNSVSVNNWQDLKAAMLDKSITNININNDILNNENDNTGSQEINVAIPLRSINFNGNGHTIDFRGTSFYNNDAIPDKANIQWNINDVKMYGQNFYGPFKAAGTSSNTSSGYGNGEINYNNVEYTGGQLTASYSYNLNFSGNINNKSVNSYISPFSKKNYNTEGNQVNIEATNINIKEDANYNGTTENGGVIYLSNNGTFKLGKNSNVKLTSGGTGGEYGTYVLRIQGNLLTDDNSKLEINTRSYGMQTAIQLDQGVGTTNQVNLNKSSNFKVNNKNSNTSGITNLIQLASNTLFSVDNNAEFDVNTVSSQTSKTNVVSGLGTSTFKIGDKGLFKVKASGSGNYNLLNFASSSNFNINNAKTFDLDARSNTNSNTNLIYMSSGNLTSKIQNIYAWNKNNLSDKYDKEWHSIFNANIPYSGSNVTNNITADSPDLDNLNDLKKNFRTQNYSRVLFTYVPDIDISITNDLTSVIKDPNSSKISGKALPGSYIKITGDPSIPKGNIKGQLQSDKNLYNTKADDNGNFTINLPDNKHLTANNTITAYGSLNGKDDTTSKVVKETPNGTLNNYLTNRQGNKIDNFETGNTGYYNASFKNSSNASLYGPSLKVNLPKEFSLNEDYLDIDINGNKINNNKLINNNDGTYNVKIDSNTEVKSNDILNIKIGMKAVSQNENIEINSSIIGFSDSNNKYSIDDIASNNIKTNISLPKISLESAPNNIAFEQNKTSVSKDKVYNSTSPGNQSVVIKDNRQDKISIWALDAQMDQFKSNDGSELDGSYLIFPKGKISANDININNINSSDFILNPGQNNSAQVLSYRGDPNYFDNDEITDSWNSSDIQLFVPKNVAKVGQNYSTNIHWNLTAGV